MLSAFQLENNRLTRLEADEIKHLASSVWVDLVEPDDEERSRVQTELGQNLATRPELEDIEASARFFEDEDGLHIHSFFFFEDAEDHAGNSTVAFTIREGRLFTLRERELPAFRLYRMRVRNQLMVDGNAYELLLDLFETKIEQLADEIENIYSDLEKLSRVIMEGRQGDEYDDALSTLAEQEDIGWKGPSVSDGYPARSELPGAQGAFTCGAAGAGARNPARYRIPAAAQRIAVPEGQLPDASGDGLYQHRAEPHHQDLLGGFRGLPAAYAGGFQLRDELRVYAGAALELWLSRRDCFYDACRSGAVSLLQA